MNFKNFIAPFLISILLAGCSQKPKISLSTERIQHKGWVTMTGEGFTPKSDVRSHLRRPDGTEFPELAILTDDSGKFTHEIDTLLFFPGKHELWVTDTKTGVTSNHATFEMTLEPVTGKP